MVTPNQKAIFWNRFFCLLDILQPKIKWNWLVGFFSSICLFPFNDLIYTINMNGKILVFRLRYVVIVCTFSVIFDVFFSLVSLSYFWFFIQIFRQHPADAIQSLKINASNLTWHFSPQRDEEQHKMKRRRIQFAIYYAHWGFGVFRFTRNRVKDHPTKSVV